MRSGKGNSGTGSAWNGNPNASGSGGELYARVRALINQNQILEAERLLNTVPPAEQNAEWNFLMGCVMLKRGYYLDAQRLFDRACAMDPRNDEYRYARERLQQQAASYGGGYRTTSTSASCCDVCSGLMCADCCCECMGGDLIRCC